MLAQAGWQRAASPLPEREVSSRLSCYSAACGGTKEHGNALCLPLTGLVFLLRL